GYDYEEALSGLEKQEDEHTCWKECQPGVFRQQRHCSQGHIHLSASTMTLEARPAGYSVRRLLGIGQSVPATISARSADVYRGDILVPQGPVEAMVSKQAFANSRDRQTRSLA